MSSEQFDEQKDNTLCEKISNLENYTADKFLGDELKEIYAQVQLECSEFRNNVFFKNLEFIEGKLGVYDNKLVGHTFNMDNIDKILKDIKLPSEMIEFYTHKAEKI